MKRLSASIPDRLYERLEKLADLEGRSLSKPCVLFVGAQY